MSSATIEVLHDQALSDDDAASLIDILNGLVYLCAHHNWFSPGHRNEVILNITVSAWMLGLNPENTLDEFVSINIIDPHKDDEDTFTRMRRMLNYTDRFSFDYMMNTTIYESYGHMIGSPDLRKWPIEFKLVK